MVRSAFAVIGSIVLLVSASVSALAWSGGVDGAPNLTHDSPTGYYIWHDDGLHIRTHGPGERHDFVGRLHTDGVFQNVDTVRLESKDDVTVGDGGHTLVMRFHTFDAEDGVNFNVSGVPIYDSTCSSTGGRSPTSASTSARMGFTRRAIRSRSAAERKIAGY